MHKPKPMIISKRILFIIGFISLIVSCEGRDTKIQSSQNLESFDANIIETPQIDLYDFIEINPHYKVKYCKFSDLNRDGIMDSIYIIEPIDLVSYDSIPEIEDWNNYNRGGILVFLSYGDKWIRAVENLNCLVPSGGRQKHPPYYIERLGAKLDTISLYTYSRNGDSKFTFLYQEPSFNLIKYDANYGRWDYNYAIKIDFLDKKITTFKNVTSELDTVSIFTHEQFMKDVIKINNENYYRYETKDYEVDTVSKLSEIKDFMEFQYWKGND